MNISENTTLSVSRKEQQRKKDMCKLGCIAKIVSSLSLLCSLLAMSLFGAIFFGPTHVLDYRKAKLIDEYAHYLVIVSVILFCLAFLLSLFKEDSKRSPDGGQTNENRVILFENKLPANDSAQNVKLKDDKLKVTKCNDEIKQGTTANSTKNAKDSTTILQKIGTSKQAEIRARTLSNKTGSLDLNKHSQEDKQLVRYKKHPKSSLYELNVPAVISPRVPNLWNVLSMITPANTTEVTSSRKVTFFPGGIAQSQEEYQVRRTTFFQCADGEISSPETPEPKFHHNGNRKFRTPSPMFKEPHKNHVSDVLTKFESMNIYY